MELESFLNAVATYGVPIVLSIYLVYWITTKLNSKLDALVSAVKELNNNIIRLIEKLEVMKDSKR